MLRPMRGLTCVLFGSALALAACSGTKADDEGSDDSSTTTMTTSTTQGDGDGDGDGDGTTGEECNEPDPLPPPPCHLPDCNHPCGCEECIPDGIKCVEYDDTVQNECSDDGICADDVDCEEGNTCISISATNGKCSENLTCEEIEQVYTAKVGNQSCGEDDHCTVIDGACEDGLGECWYAANTQATADLPELVMQWTAKSCGSGDTCGGDCGAEPAVACVENVCTIQ
jgi:hypothetical protein